MKYPLLTDAEWRHCEASDDWSAVWTEREFLKALLYPFGIFAELEDTAHAGHLADDDFEVLRSSQVGPTYKTLTVGDFRRARDQIRDACQALVDAVGDSRGIATGDGEIAVAYRYALKVLMEIGGFS